MVLHYHSKIILLPIISIPITGSLVIQIQQQIHPLKPTPNYTYPDSGVYVVKLVVNRGEKCSDSTYTRALVYPGFIPGFEVKQSCFLNPLRIC